MADPKSRAGGSSSNDSEEELMTANSGELDFFSPNFNAEQAIYSSDVLIPHPGVKSFETLKSYEDAVKRRRQLKTTPSLTVQEKLSSPLSTLTPACKSVREEQMYKIEGRSYEMHPSRHGKPGPYKTHDNSPKELATRIGKSCKSREETVVEHRYGSPINRESVPRPSSPMSYKRSDTHTGFSHSSSMNLHESGATFRTQPSYETSRNIEQPDHRSSISVSSRSTVTPQHASYKRHESTPFKFTEMSEHELSRSHKRSSSFSNPSHRSDDIPFNMPSKSERKSSHKVSSSDYRRATEQLGRSHERLPSVTPRSTEPHCYTSARRDDKLHHTSSSGYEKSHETSSKSCEKSYPEPSESHEKSASHCYSISKHQKQPQHLLNMVHNEPHLGTSTDYDRSSEKLNKGYETPSHFMSPNIRKPVWESGTRNERPSTSGIQESHSRHHSEQRNQKPRFAFPSRGPGFTNPHEQKRVDFERTDTHSDPSRASQDRLIKKRNVFTRMEDMTGPLKFLTRCVQQRQQVRVMTRGAVNVRSICRGYIIAFDKHFNMAMMDVDEIYRRPTALGKVKARRSHRLMAAQKTLKKEREECNARWNTQSQTKSKEEQEITKTSTSLQVLSLRSEQLMSLAIENFETKYAPSLSELSSVIKEPDAKTSLELDFHKLTKPAQARLRKIESVYEGLKAPMSPFEREALMLGIADENVDHRHVNQMLIRGENVVSVTLVEDI